MTGSTMVAASAPHAGTDPQGVAQAQAATAAGMAASEARQSQAASPMGGAVSAPAPSTMQPYVDDDPGDGPGGVT